MAVCATCQKPLTLDIHDQEEGEEDAEETEGSSSAQRSETVPDDVQLQCGCHFHWQCLLDSYELTECPVCTHHIACTTSSGTQQVLCTLHNEGGLQENLDILPLLTEESYLKAYPEERKARAFLEFCREGDVDAIVDLLKAVEDDSEEEEEGPQMSPSDILRYQDPTGSLHSGLHIAVMSGQVGVIWLLLWITSSLEVYKFPIELFRAAEEHAMGREDLGPNKMDIRALTDASGVMAVHYADPHTLAGFNVDYLTPP